MFKIITKARIQKQETSMLNGNMMTDRSTENMEIEHQPLAYMTCTQDINIYYASVMEYHTTAPEKHADLPMK